MLVARRRGVELAVRTVGKYLARWGFTAQKPIRRAWEQDPAGWCGAGSGGSTRPSWRAPGGSGA